MKPEYVRVEGTKCEGCGVLHQPPTHYIYNYRCLVAACETEHFYCEECAITVRCPECGNHPLCNGD